MSLEDDDLPGIVGHRRLRQSWRENDYGDEDGSPEALEAMAREGAARRKADPARWRDRSVVETVDTRVFGAGDPANAETWRDPETAA